MGSEGSQLAGAWAALLDEHPLLIVSALIILGYGVLVPKEFGVRLACAIPLAMYTTLCTWSLVM